MILRVNLYISQQKCHSKIIKSFDIRLSMNQSELFLVVSTFEYLNQLFNKIDIRYGGLNKKNPTDGTTQAPINKNLRADM